LNKVNYIESLTGLRGLAALIVFVSHSANAGLLPPVVGNGFGQVGVLIFFALSGFLMAHLYLNRPLGFSDFVDYAMARIARVFPLYFMVVLLSTLASNHLQADSWYPFVFTDPNLIASSLLMLKSKYVLWSIPVEVQFYVVFVGLWALVAKNISRMWILVYLISIPIPTVAYFVYCDLLPNVISKFSHVFVLGIIIASIHKQVSGNKKVVVISNWLGLPALVLMLINLPELRLNTGLASNGSTYFRVWLDPATLTIIFFVVLFTALESSGLSWLRCRVCLYLGQISYGIYLFHFPILMFYLEYLSLGKAGVVFFSMISTIISAHLSLVYLERPASSFLRKRKVVSSVNS